jgi:hypothetical protein
MPDDRQRFEADDEIRGSPRRRAFADELQLWTAPGQLFEEHP